jgi:DNA-binding LacI/PurR family transcriptional regulator
MTEARKQPKYVQIRQTVLEQISDLAPGSRIAGVTALAQQFGVARATAERVLKDLARQGYLRQVSGSGTYVADRRVKKVGVLTYEQQPRESAFYSVVGETLTRQLQERGHDVHLLYRDEVHGPSLQHVRRVGADAYAAVGLMNAPYLESIAALSDAIVAVDYRPMSLRVDSVTVASMRCAYLATRSLLLAGRSRLWYLGFQRMQHQLEADTAAQRIGFERAHFEAGVELSPDSITHVRYGQELENACELIDSRGAPHGVVCFDERTASQLCDRLRAAGRRVPDDVAVIACGGQRKTVSLFLVDPAEMGRVAANLLSERLAWPELPARDYEIWPDYHDGGTVPQAATTYIMSLLRRRPARAAGPRKPPDS